MTISIFKFLLVYYGVALDASCECSHKDLKQKFNFLRRCSFEFASNRVELVATGKIMYVTDTYNNIAPYLCPNELIMTDEECSFTNEFMNDFDNDMIIDNLSNLSTYNLRILLSRYKKMPSFYKLIKKELVSRGVYQNKKYRICREINKMEIEESDFYDKYKRRRKIKCNES